MENCLLHPNFEIPCLKCGDEEKFNFTTDFALGDTITFGGNLRLTLTSINGENSEVTYKVTQENG